MRFKVAVALELHELVLSMGDGEKRLTGCSRIEKQLRRRVWRADVQYQNKMFRLAGNSKPMWLATIVGPRFMFDRCLTQVSVCGSNEDL